MAYSISPISDEDRKPIMDIFNHYVENSFAAYPENKLPYEAFDMFMQMSKGYPTGSIKDEKGNIVGFGMLRTHHPMATFLHTAELTYFIHPEHTGKGLWTRLLDFLEKGGRKRGIKTILANISSLNPGSIAFHQKNGFKACGRFKNIGKKNGHVFDTLWMQKMLQEDERARLRGR